MALHELNGRAAAALAALALVVGASAAMAQTETVPQATYLPPGQAESGAQPAPQTAPAPLAPPVAQSGQAPQQAPEPVAAPAQQSSAPRQDARPRAAAEQAAPAQAAPAQGASAAGEATPQRAGALPQRIGDSTSLSAGAAITVPSTVDAGQTVNVVVEGAAQGAQIELWGPVTEGSRGERLAAGPLTGGTAALTAPDVSGSYELRYLDASGQQLGRRAFDVAAVPVALSLQTPVERGGVLDVTWQGPASPGDRFEIIGPTGAVVDSTPVAGNPHTANVSALTAPTETGAYQLRYVSGRGGVLRSVGFAVR